MRQVLAGNRGRRCEFWSWTTQDHLRRVMRLTLEASGYDVAEAGDGEAALRLFGDGGRSRHDPARPADARSRRPGNAQAHENAQRRCVHHHGDRVHHRRTGSRRHEARCHGLRAQADDARDASSRGGGKFAKRGRKTGAIRGAGGEPRTCRLHGVRWASKKPLDERLLAGGRVIPLPGPQRTAVETRPSKRARGRRAVLLVRDTAAHVTLDHRESGSWRKACTSAANWRGAGRGSRGRNPDRS